MLCDFCSKGSTKNNCCVCGKRVQTSAASALMCRQCSSAQGHLGYGYKRCTVCDGKAQHNQCGKINVPGKLCSSCGLNGKRKCAKLK